MTPNPFDILNPTRDNVQPDPKSLVVPDDDDPFPVMSPFIVEHRPKGKIARLPKQIRDEINAMIRDGLSYPAIVKKLQQSGQPELLAISEQNLSNWKNGGHQHWLRQQEWREEMREEREEALAMAAGDDHVKFEKIALKMAAMRLFQFFKYLEPAAFLAVARERPESFARLFHALPLITRECLRLQQYADDSLRDREPESKI
jgi:hypothetical protein